MADNPFAALGLKDELVATLGELGYEAPTPIQERTIPILLAGRDLIGQAQTGTGKTAAFALPMLQHLDPASKSTQALVLAPTRELAMQVAEAIHTYAQKLGAVSVLPVYGGAPIVHQLKRLERGAQVVVGTPGRLIDHLDRGTLKLGGVKMIVLDEADEMLKMGFIEDIERILSSAPKPRQTALFSATMPAEVLRISKRYLESPENIAIEHKAINTPAIEQRFINVSEGQKLEVLTRILELEQGGEAVLIFRRTKNGAAELAEKLEGRGFAAVAMHGDMSQPLREGVIRRLRAGQVEIVVATDVAARGLDVEQITHVVNYDVPHDVEVYVHRIGRTGRAGRSGIATLFITPRERRMMREIERFTGLAIKPMKMPSGADVAAHRVSQFKDSIRKTILEGELDLYVELIEQLVDEGTHEITEIAAAAARLATISRRLAPEPEPAAMAPRPSDRPDRPAAPPPEDGEDRTVTLQMSVGRNDGVRPADVVGSIANEADIPGREIGPIEILDDVTYVGVPERHVERVIEAVRNAKFKGRPVSLRRAEARSGVAPRRSSAPPRGEGGPPRRAGAPPPRPYTRTADDRPPRKPFVRDAEDQPARKPYVRSSEDAPARKPYVRSTEGAPARKPYVRSSEGAPARKPYVRSSEGAPARKPYVRSSEGAPARKPYVRSSEDRPPRRDDAAPRKPYRKPEEGGRPTSPFRSAAAPAARKPYRASTEERGPRRPPSTSGGFDKFRRTPAGGPPKKFGPPKGPKGRK